MQTASTSKVRSAPAGRPVRAGLGDRRALHAAVALGAHDHVAPDDPADLRAVLRVLDEPLRMARPSAARRRSHSRRRVASATATTSAPSDASCAATGSRNGPAPASSTRLAGQHALALRQRLRAARGQHARQRPAREGDRAVVGAGAEHDRLRAHARRPGAGEHQHARLRRAPDRAAGEHLGAGGGAAPPRAHAPRRGSERGAAASTSSNRRRQICPPGAAYSSITTTDDPA